MISRENNGPRIESALLMLMLVCSAARINEKESERAFARPFILLGKAIRLEWPKSFSLVENINQDHNSQNNFRARQ